MYGKNNMETYIIICKIDSQEEFDVWFRKLKQGLCINLGGGLTDLENKLLVAIGCQSRGRRETWEFETDRYALLCLELITKKEPVVCIAQATLPNPL